MLGKYFGYLQTQKQEGSIESVCEMGWAGVHLENVDGRDFIGAESKVLRVGLHESDRERKCIGDRKQHE